ncbi:hypothetical protein Micbo1qcDRAFT_160150 [Microdochium bolleyi]|uniref:Mid2 domain-containing protein n=1 Tax=Microdochium bolleyi TaxID=196109 RepID=A0A136JCF6_9PEZI|nr:hypothetical protein Micbo1qcDRAFT_160150 [Microdochium bolleyi]
MANSYSGHSRSQSFVVSITLLLLAFILHVNAACYYPNGNLAPNDVPCKSNTVAAACCGQGYACLSNGICQPTGNELLEPGASGFVRGSCTDQKWTNPGCPYFCIDPKINNVAGGHGIAKCKNRSDDSYYCIDSEHDETTCAKGGFLFFIGKPSALTTIGVVAPTSSSTTSSARSSTSAESSGNTLTSTTISAPSTPPPPATAPAAANPSSDPPKDNTALIAGVVAGVLGGLILGAAGVWLLRRFFQKRKDARDAAAAAAAGGNNYPITVNNNDESKSTAEAHHYYQQQQQQQQQVQEQGQSYGLWSTAGNKPELDGGHSHSIGGSTAIYEAGTRSPQELPADPQGWR